MSVLFSVHTTRNTKSLERREWVYYNKGKDGLLSLLMIQSIARGDEHLTPDKSNLPSVHLFGTQKQTMMMRRIVTIPERMIQSTSTSFCWTRSCMTTSRYSYCLSSLSNSTTLGSHQPAATTTTAALLSYGSKVFE